MNSKPDNGVDSHPTKPPIKMLPSEASQQRKISIKKEPRGIKAWLIRIINGAIKRLSKFS